MNFHIFPPFHGILEDSIMVVRRPYSVTNPSITFCTQFPYKRVPKFQTRQNMPCSFCFEFLKRATSLILPALQKYRLRFPNPYSTGSQGLSRRFARPARPARGGAGRSRHTPGSGRHRGCYALLVSVSGGRQANTKQAQEVGNILKANLTWIAT